jgi:hypothetical protein
VDLLHDNLVLEVVDDTETSDGLGEEDKDFLRSLEKKEAETVR